MFSSGNLAAAGQKFHDHTWLTIQRAYENHPSCFRIHVLNRRGFAEGASFFFLL